MLLNLDDSLTMFTLFDELRDAGCAVSVNVDTVLRVDITYHSRKTRFTAASDSEMLCYIVGYQEAFEALKGENNDG